MQTPPIIPSKDPADNGTLSGLLNISNRKAALADQTQLPCVVISYSRATGRATVRPLISMLTTSGKLVARPAIASVPVLALGGGGFTLTFPLKAGDLGWIEASDRDISLFMQSKADSAPNTLRIHNFADGRFIPDAFAAYTFDAADDGSSMVLQSYDGTVKIALDPAAIRLIAPTVKVQASTLFTVTAPAISLNQTGGGVGTTFTGSPVVMPNAIIGGVTQSTHKHNGVQTGTGVSGGPQN